MMQGQHQTCATCWLPRDTKVPLMFFVSYRNESSDFFKSGWLYLLAQWDGAVQPRSDQQQMDEERLKLRWKRSAVLKSYARAMRRFREFGYRDVSDSWVTFDPLSKQPFEMIQKSNVECRISFGSLKKMGWVQGWHWQRMSTCCHYVSMSLRTRIQTGYFSKVNGEDGMKLAYKGFPRTGKLKLPVLWFQTCGVWFPMSLPCNATEGQRSHFV